MLETERAATCVRAYLLVFESQLTEALDKVGISKSVLGAGMLLNVIDGFDVERMIRADERATDLRQRLALAATGWQSAKSD